MITHIDMWTQLLVTHERPDEGNGILVLQSWELVVYKKKKCRHPFWDFRGPLVLPMWKARGVPLTKAPNHFSDEPSKITNAATLWHLYKTSRAPGYQAEDIVCSGKARSWVMGQAWRDEAVKKHTCSLASVLFRFSIKVSIKTPNSTTAKRTDVGSRGESGSHPWVSLHRVLLPRARNQTLRS